MTSQTKKKLYFIILMLVLGFVLTLIPTIKKMGLVQLTPVGKANPNLYNVNNLSEISESKGTSAVTAIYNNGKNAFNVQETLDAIWAQQQTTKNNLGAILVTEQGTGLRKLLFKQNLSKVVPTEGGAQVVAAKGGVDSINVTQSVTDIYTYQGSGGQVDLGMVLVTRTSDGKQIILFDHTVEQINAEAPAGSNSEIHYIPTFTQNKVPINDTVAALFTAQPK